MSRSFLCVFVCACVAVVVADTTTCWYKGQQVPCGPTTSNHCQQEPFGRGTPQFHIKSMYCGENDPNGPMYDPVHNMYHAFYQDHVAIPQNGIGRGPDWGHAVSKDFIHWASLPEAIWNDQWYDLAAIYTGSTTIVDGKPVIVYPGICDHSHPSCDTGTALNIALPADPTDPLYVKWMKPSYNPIVNNTQRDPSTAFKTEAGEWRLTTYTGDVYRSMDFVHWNVAGNLFPTGECPSFFPLPDLVPGFKPTASMPTHVHKRSAGGKDLMTVGTYSVGELNTTGTWTQTPGVDFTAHIIDVGDYYASKDFWDPVKERRLNYGWAKVPPASTQTLPRKAWYHPVHQRVFWSPVEEQAQLRGADLHSASNVVVEKGVSLFTTPPTAANQSELVATFDLPESAATFGVVLMSDAGGSSFMEVTVEYVPPGAGVTAYNATVRMGAGPVSPPSSNTEYEPGYDLPGDDYNVTNVNYTDPHTCQQVCFADPKCAAYTYVVRPPLHAACCLKSSVPGWNPNPSCTSGTRKPVAPPSGGGGYSDTLPLLATDKTVTVRVFTDNTFLEAYWSAGSSSGAGIAMTASVKSAGNTMQAAGFVSNGAVTARSVDLWAVDSIWVSPEEVLAQHEASVGV